MTSRKSTRNGTSTRVPAVRLAKPSGRPYQLRYTDPLTSKEIRISTGTHDAAAAEDQRQTLIAKLRLGLDATPSKKIRGEQMQWSDFRDEYSRLKLATLRDATAASTENRLDVCERIIQPRTLREMASPANLERLKSELLVGSEARSKRKKRRSPHTCNSYLAALVAALNWAHKQRWLPDRVPQQEIAADDPDKGRALVGEEIERMLTACETICSHDVASWQYLLRGLVASGLRLAEAMNLSWDIPGTIQVVTERRGVVLEIPGGRQKNRRTQTIPTTPELRQLLEQHPTKQGWVFNPSSARGPQRLTFKQVGRIVSLIGDKAGVVVSASGKTASCHDLRRTFGQRLADRGVSPRDLKAIMRHRSLATTEKYYLRDDAHEIGERLEQKLGTVVPNELGTHGRKQETPAGSTDPSQPRKPR